MRGVSSIGDRIRSPRAALLANVALVVGGSVLSLLGSVDPLTGAVIVATGFLGVTIVVAGSRRE